MAGYGPGPAAVAGPAINVVVPLGGLGSRFQKEGYITRCKPFVPVLGKPMILWVLDGLCLREDDTLVIVYNPSFMGIGNFMREVVAAKFPTCRLVELAGPTRGAAETVLLGLRGLDPVTRKRPTLLAECDTFYTVNVVQRFRAVAESHNAVFCFEDTQPKPIYSYVELDKDDTVLRVKEKVKISDWANSGCYCFRDGAQLASECEALIEANSRQKSQDGVGEFYTSGVIAAMLDKKEPFRGLKLDANAMHVLGTPSQVADFCATWAPQPRQRFVFDLEGALIVAETEAPIERNVETCRRLKKQGHTIIVQTTRPDYMQDKTWSLLETLEIPCDDLRMGKVVGDFYIGGANTFDALVVDIDKQVGFYPSEVPASAKLLDARPAKSRKAAFNSVGALQPDDYGVSCLVKLLEEPQPVDSHGRTFMEVPCGDETARVTLSLTPSQAEGLVKDQVIVVRNGTVKMVNGYMRLIVDKRARIDRDLDCGVQSIGESDMSATRYELVSK